jgi:hypothetical protein
MYCAQCGAHETVDVLRRGYSREDTINMMEAFANAHEHHAPRPLTRKQREAVRLASIHRRGALRCGYGAHR